MLAAGQLDGFCQSLDFRLYPAAVTSSIALVSANRCVAIRSSSKPMDRARVSMTLSHRAEYLNHLASLRGHLCGSCSYGCQAVTRVALHHRLPRDELVDERRSGGQPIAHASLGTSKSGWSKRGVRVLNHRRPDSKRLSMTRVMVSLFCCADAQDAPCYAVDTVRRSSPQALEKSPCTFRWRAFARLGSWRRVYRDRRCSCDLLANGVRRSKIALLPVENGSKHHCHFVGATL